MCSELFRIPVEYNGLPILGFGLLLVIWLFAGAITIFYVGRASNWSSDTWGYLPGFLIGAAAIVLIPKLFPEGLPIRGYGVMVLLGAVTGLWMAFYRARQVGLDPDVLLSLAFGMFISGIVGARLFFVIEYWDTRFDKGNLRDTLLEVMKFTEGGLVFYGSIIGGTLAYVYLARRHKLPVLALADLIAPSVMVGLAFGRLGCLLNGCCYGGLTDHPWGVSFPHDSIPYVEQLSDGLSYGVRLGPLSAEDPRPVIAAVAPESSASELGVEAGTRIAKIDGETASDIHAVRSELYDALEARAPLELVTSEGAELELPYQELSRSRRVHPAQIYSSINAGLLAWLLWSFFPFRTRDGQVVALLLTLYPVSRFLLEIIRIDESAVFGTGLSISQNISVALLAGAALLWVWLWRQPLDKSELAFAAKA